MPTRIGINGFGRMGRLALRAGWDRPNLQFVHINETSGGPEAAAHLLMFDSVHGRWNRTVKVLDGKMDIDGQVIDFSAAPQPSDAPWTEHQIDVLLECSGKFRTRETLEPYFAAGVK